MTDDEAVDLRAQNAGLQRQLVEMRMRMDQMADGLAGLVKHLVEKEVEHIVGPRLPTELERRHLTSIYTNAVERARIRLDVLVHLAKWGVGGGVGFLLYASWESVKAKLRGG